MFPQSVLANIYVKGSLKNTDKGFEFNLKNVVDSGTVVELGPITIDGTPYQAAALMVITSSQERAGDQVSRQAPMPVYFGSSFTIRVKGVTLAAGAHVIHVSINTREAGRLSFEARDTVA